MRRGSFGPIRAALLGDGWGIAAAWVAGIAAAGRSLRPRRRQPTRRRSRAGCRPTRRSTGPRGAGRLDEAHPADPRAGRQASRVVAAADDPGPAALRRQGGRRRPSGAGAGRRRAARPPRRLSQLRRGGAGRRPVQRCPAQLREGPGRSSAPGNGQTSRPATSAARSPPGWPRSPRRARTGRRRGGRWRPCWRSTRRTARCGSGSAACCSGSTRWMRRSPRSKQAAPDTPTPRARRRLDGLAVHPEERRQEGGGVVRLRPQARAEGGRVHRARAAWLLDRGRARRRRRRWRRP